MNQPQPQPPIFDVVPKVFKTSIRHIVPLYLTNNHWDAQKSEARRKELLAKRAEKEAKEKIERNKLFTSPSLFRDTTDFLSDVIDDNNYHPKQNEVVTDKVKF